MDGKPRHMKFKDKDEGGSIPMISWTLVVLCGLGHFILILLLKHYITSPRKEKMHPTTVKAEKCFFFFFFKTCAIFANRDSENPPA